MALARLHSDFGDVERMGANGGEGRGGTPEPSDSVDQAISSALADIRDPSQLTSDTAASFSSWKRALLSGEPGTWT